MSLLLPSNARGPILDLELPESEQPIAIVLRNITTGKQLTINLPGDYEGGELYLDFYRRTIKDETGADWSAMLDPQDNELWTPEPLVAGANDVEIEALGGAVAAEDDFNQSAGDLTGKALDAGGIWEELPLSDPEDFVVNAVAHTAQRTAVSDVGARSLRVSSLSLLETRVRLDLKMPESIEERVEAGPFCREVKGQRLEAILDTEDGSPSFVVRLSGFGAISPSVPLSQAETAALEAGEWFTIDLAARGNQFGASFGVKGTLPSEPVVSGFHELLETTQAEGGVGITDRSQDAGAVTRQFDRFRAYDLTSGAPYTAIATLRWEKGYY